MNFHKLALSEVDINFILNILNNVDLRGLQGMAQALRIAQNLSDVLKIDNQINNEVGVNKEKNNK